MDYIELQKYIIHTIDDEINKNADLNDDGKINTADFFALRKIVTKN